MLVDVEKVLSSELREVADGLAVPPPPAPPQRPSSTRHFWQPLLVAAAIVLLVAGTVAVATSIRGGEPPRPAPSPPERPSTRALTTALPAVPYVVDGRLHVEGDQLPGTWWSVESAGDAWLALRDDDTWWWGTGTEPVAVPGEVSGSPHLSPDGSLLAVGSLRDGGGDVLLAETRSGGDIVSRLSIDSRESSSTLGVDAVTDDGQVFFQDSTGRRMWLPRDGETVDLDSTAADQWVQRSTPAGLVVLDGTRDGEPDATYLAEASDAGGLTRIRTLPSEQVIVNPSATWLAHGGSWGGESVTTASIEAQRIDGGQELRLEPPDERSLLALAWEDDDLLIAELHSDGTPTGLARCSVRERRCLVLDALEEGAASADARG